MKTMISALKYNHWLAAFHNSINSKNCACNKYPDFIWSMGNPFIRSSLLSSTVRSRSVIHGIRCLGNFAISCLFFMIVVFNVDENLICRFHIVSPKGSEEESHSTLHLQAEYSWHYPRCGHLQVVNLYGRSKISIVWETTYKQAQMTRGEKHSALIE